MQALKRYHMCALTFRSSVHTYTHTRARAHTYTYTHAHYNVQLKLKIKKKKKKSPQSVRFQVLQSPSFIKIDSSATLPNTGGRHLSFNDANKAEVRSTHAQNRGGNTRHAVVGRPDSGDTGLPAGVRSTL